LYHQGKIVIKIHLAINSSNCCALAGKTRGAMVFACPFLWLLSFGHQKKVTRRRQKIIKFNNPPKASNSFTIYTF
jgi:hypothetical protein